VSAAIRAEDDAVRDMPESEWLRREAAEARAHKPPRSLSAEHKQKISAAQKGRAVNGPLMTPDHKARLTAALRRYAPNLTSAQAQAAISRGMRWMHANPEHKAKRLAGVGARINTCSRCGESGHNVRTCKRQPLQPESPPEPPQRAVYDPEILE
jgi:hypothetical protein